MRAPAAKALPAIFFTPGPMAEAVRSRLTDQAKHHAILLPAEHPSHPLFPAYGE